MKKIILIMASFGLLPITFDSFTQEEVKKGAELKIGLEEVKEAEEQHFMHKLKRMVLSKLLANFQALNKRHEETHNRLLKQRAGVIEAIKGLKEMGNQKRWIDLQQRMHDNDAKFYFTMEHNWRQFNELVRNAQELLKKPLNYQELVDLYNKFHDLFKVEWALEGVMSDLNEKDENEQYELIFAEFEKIKPQEVKIWRAKRALETDPEHKKIIKDQEESRGAILNLINELEGMAYESEPGTPSSAGEEIAPPSPRGEQESPRSYVQPPSPRSEGESEEEFE